MKTTKKIKFAPIFWGIVLVLAAVLLILDGVGVNFGIELSAWRIILGVLLLAWLVFTCVNLRFTEVFFPLAFLFLVFEGPIANALGRTDGNLINNWIVLLAALLLTIGTKAIFSRRGAVCVRSGDGDDNDENTTRKIGSSTLYFDGADLSNVEIKDNLGSVHAYFTDKDAYTGGGIITVHSNLGSVVLHLPKEWDVLVQSSSNLGRVHVPPKEQSGGVSITLVAKDNLGNVSVVFE